MWTDIETLPEVGVDVLVFAPELGAVAIASLERDSGGLYWESDCDALALSPASSVSHWMPLPEPPASR
jgi:hypothetical protein